MYARTDSLEPILLYLYEDYVMKYKVLYSEDMKEASYFGAIFKEIDDGYYRCLQRNHARGYLLHRFIYEVETGEKIPKKYNVHHKDGDKTNNNIENLECIPNSVHTKIHNTPSKIEKCVNAMKKANKEKGYPGCRASNLVKKKNNYPSLQRSNKKRRKPIIMYSLNMEIIKRFDSLLDAARYLDKPPAHISNCANGRNKTAFGFIWRWENDFNAP